MRVLDTVHGEASKRVVGQHVALPKRRPVDRALVRLNMISSADGGSAVAGLSGGLGNRDDHAVFAALRDAADGVIVGLGTAVAEHYHAPTSSGLELFVIADTPDISGALTLFESDHVVLVLPEDAGPVTHDHVRVLRSGRDGTADLRGVVAGLAGKVLVAEGGPMLAGALASLGLIDEFFLTVSPRVVAGESRRVVHGPDADPDPWHLAHGFVDEEGFLFLRYQR
jgi:riboflavin biosynthesis pyrimidine reductase